ncbi:hypothetical protein [Streptomyces sp. CB01881]|uniref:hypothetical protein n=1 Tax=Streptomyces sp. CB01881 TaxID=2078691 RepID=UPI00129C32DA|nr:hypothetical protein [Streptomyces sp. CB01881]
MTEFKSEQPADEPGQEKEPTSAPASELEAEPEPMPEDQDMGKRRSDFARRRHRSAVDLAGVRSVAGA